MTDYSKMSDFEINKSVAIAIKPELSNMECFDISARAVFAITGLLPPGPSIPPVYQGYSFISDPNYAWPIIQEHGIELFYDGISWSAACGWRGIQQYNDWRNHPEEPLRMAMIVFLMMKEAENDPR